MNSSCISCSLDLGAALCTFFTGSFVAATVGGSSGSGTSSLAAPADSSSVVVAFTSTTGSVTAVATGSVTDSTTGSVTAVCLSPMFLVPNSTAELRSVDSFAIISIRLFHATPVGLISKLLPPRLTSNCLRAVISRAVGATPAALARVIRLSVSALSLCLSANFLRPFKCLLARVVSPALTACPMDVR